MADAEPITLSSENETVYPEHVITSDVPTRRNVSLTDLVDRGCDLKELRESSAAELNEMLTVLGFESADDRSTLEGLLKASPGDLSGEALAKWAAETEGRIEGALNVEGLIAKAEALKAQGNESFKAQELGKASSVYQEAVEVLTSPSAKKLLHEWWAAHKKDPSSVDSASPLLASLHTNLAACHNKLGQWEMGANAATSALAVDPANVKARFRRGVANSNLGNFDEAKADLTAAVRADPKNREARTALEVVTAALQERRKSEKEAFSKAFSGPSLYVRVRAARTAPRRASRGGRRPPAAPRVGRRPLQITRGARLAPTCGGRRRLAG